MRDQAVSKAYTGRRWRPRSTCSAGGAGAKGDADPSERPAASSAWMLYEMARAFGSATTGSSARAWAAASGGSSTTGSATRRPRRSAGLPLVPWRLTVERDKAARNVSLGVCMRLQHVLLDDHTARNEVGILVVSARIHAGWRRLAGFAGRTTRGGRWRAVLPRAPCRHPQCGRSAAPPGSPRSPPHAPARAVSTPRMRQTPSSDEGAERRLARQLTVLPSPGRSQPQSRGSRRSTRSRSTAASSSRSRAPPSPRTPVPATPDTPAVALPDGTSAWWRRS